MPEKSKSRVAAYLVFTRDEKTLLLLRHNTGYEDGNYGLVSGHVEEGESVIEGAIREAHEEAGVCLSPGGLALAHVMHRKAAEPCLDFFFQVNEWEGAIENLEPHKCAELTWFHPSDFPENTIPYVKEALGYIGAGTQHSTYGW